MTISNPQVRQTYLGDGTSVNFTIPWLFYANSDIGVYLASAKQTTGYSIAGAGVGSGTVTFSSPPASGVLVTLLLDVPLTQLVNLVDGTAFPSSTLDEVNDRAIQASLRLNDKIGRSLSVPDGDLNPQTTLPAAAARANTFMGFDSNGNLSLGQTLPSGTLSQGSIGLFLYPRTSAEQALGIAPVNYWYAPGVIDRYGTNLGGNDMAPALSSAIQVAALLGCRVVVGPTAPYTLSSPINGTGVHGVVVEDHSSGAASNSSFCSLIINHNGHGFDLSASYECTFRGLSAKTAPGKTPKSLFFCARNPAGSDAGLHRFENIRVANNSTFQWVFYGYGSEQNNFFNCVFQNAQPSATLISHNATNPSNYTSTFVAIATGSQSNSMHRHVGCSYFNFGNSGSHNEYIFALDNAVNFTFRDGLWGCAHGGGYILGQVNPSLNVTLDSIRGEPMGSQPAHGVDLTATNGVYVSWTFNNVTSDCAGFFFAMASNTSMQNLAMRATTTTSGNLVSAFNLSNSVIETMIDSVVAGQPGGTVSNNVFMGGRNNVVTNGGAFSDNIYLDNNQGQVGIDGDSVQLPAVNCSGALTIPAQWSLSLSANGHEVTVALPPTQGTTSAQPSFSYGTAIPARYLPPSDLRQLVSIKDNGTSPPQPGLVFISAATGVIQVFKDLSNGNYTSGGAGGLPGLTIISWLI